MTRRYHGLPAADQDLDDQAAYLVAEASLEIALRCHDAANINFGKIASTPGIGERWPSSSPRLTGMRICRIEGFEKHLIFYRAVDNEIEIVRVIHGARDIDRLLESGPPD
jgi:toxin ParE1/3/4